MSDLKNLFQEEFNNSKKLDKSTEDNKKKPLKEWGDLLLKSLSDVFISIVYLLIQALILYVAYGYIQTKFTSLPPLTYLFFISILFILDVFIDKINTLDIFRKKYKKDKN